MTQLTSASELAAANPIRWPNENAACRAARNTLLAHEIELRRAIEAVAAERRTLPPGPEVSGDYRFLGVDGVMDLPSLFGDHETLVDPKWYPRLPTDWSTPCPR